MAVLPPILIVEDNPGDLELVREAFREAGVDNPVEGLSDAAEALSFLRREGRHAGAPRPALVMVDLSLPRMDGRELLARIKEDRALCRVPVIVFSSSPAPDDIGRALDLHANAYVRKPGEYEQLLQTARAIGGFWLDVAERPLP